MEINMRKINLYLVSLLTGVLLASCSIMNLNKPQIPVINACEEDLTVEFVSLVGDKVSQKVYLTIRFTNHDINQTKQIRDFRAYTVDGDIFSDSYPTDNFETLTDVPVKAAWEVGQMVPKKNPKLAALRFTISGCDIEMRDIPIKWKELDNNKK